MPKSNPSIYGFTSDLPDLDPAEISPGVRDLVVALREVGLFTTDSGDGSNYEAGMECALPYPHVFVVCPLARAGDVVTIARHVIDTTPGLIDWPARVTVAESVEGGGTIGSDAPDADVWTAVMIDHEDSAAPGKPGALFGWPEYSPRPRVARAMFIEHEDTEWPLMWAGLAGLDPFGDTTAAHDGEVWQYMGTEREASGVVHCFRHRSHPSDGHRRSEQVPCSAEFAARPDVVALAAWRDEDDAIAF